MSLPASIQAPADGTMLEIAIAPSAPASGESAPRKKEWRRQLFWKLQGASWGGGALLTIVFANTGYFPWYDAILLGSLRTAFGFAVTCGLRYAYRPLRRNPGNRWLTAIAIFFLCGGLGVADAAVIILAGNAIGIDLATSGMTQFLAGGIFMRWMIYWLWSVFYFGINYWLDTEDARLRLAQAEAAARSSELQLLRSQVNPHFLFNALNSIMAESEDPVVVHDLTQALSDYLRFSLQQRGDIQRLGVELDALENYLRVEKTRFEEDLEYSIEADATARHALAPIALVQPLLDNAIKYGQHSPIRPLRLTISAILNHDLLTIGVANSGNWITPGTVGSTGTGLANLRRRLQLLYEDAASLKVEAGEEKVHVTVQLPVLKEEGGTQ